MPKALCPECTALVEITPAEEIAHPWTARRWKLDVHKDPYRAIVCPGSGRKV